MARVLPINLVLPPEPPPPSPAVLASAEPALPFEFIPPVTVIELAMIKMIPPPSAPADPPATTACCPPPPPPHRRQPHHCYYDHLHHLHHLPPWKFWLPHRFR